MDKEIDIEILEELPEEPQTPETEQEEPQEQTQLPLNFLNLGEIENDDVQVYIKQSTYKALEKLAASDTSKELGSILIGEYSQEMGRTNVVITNHIEAKYTDASAATLTFTHETWDYVHKQHDKRYPDKKIIGWQHTHPNYGIFLSNYDLFIQENFFNMPFQIAYVIDPVQNLRGFFQWKNGKIEKLKGYYIYDDVGKAIKIDQPKKKKEKEETEETKPVAKTSRWSAVLIALLCVAVVILSVALISLSRAQQTILERLEVQGAVVVNQAQTIDELQTQLGDSQTSVEDLIAMIESNELKIQDQEEVIKELQALTGAGEETQEDVYIRFKVHTVVPGETLSKICQAYGIDYRANRKIILAINGITNANLIYSGQQLLIPVYN